MSLVATQTDQVDHRAPKRRAPVPRRHVAADTKVPVASQILLSELEAPRRHTPKVKNRRARSTAAPQAQWAPAELMPSGLRSRTAMGSVVSTTPLSTATLFSDMVRAKMQEVLVFVIAITAQKNVTKRPVFQRAQTQPAATPARHIREKLRNWRSQTNAIGAFGAVTLAYWAFMLTDGALRMLVLLHFHILGFSAIQLAFMFLLYEIMGIVTNLSAGWLAARFGLSTTLFAGLALQIAALTALSQLNPAWTLGLSVVFVMLVQGASGVAKDLTKMSSKSAVKLLAPKNQKGALFKWVAALTGSKNAIKGLGFFLGAALLATFGFQLSVIMMALSLALVFAAVVAFLPKGLPIGRKNTKFSEVLSKDPKINKLSMARIFLFGARDAWFVVGIPAYFFTVLSDGTAAGMRTAFFLIGAFMALWLIGYGLIQAIAPRLLKAKEKEVTEIVKLSQKWAGILAFVPAALSLAALIAGGATAWLTATLVIGLLIFGGVFAVNSSLHSYLILAFTKEERAALDVGFYYMANATGRLLGTLLSGVTYYMGGLPMVLASSTVLTGLSWYYARDLSSEFEKGPSTADERVQAKRPTRRAIPGRRHRTAVGAA